MRAAVPVLILATLALSLSVRAAPDPSFPPQQSHGPKCDAGDMQACVKLGYFYQVMRKDYATAIEFYRRACSGGDAMGCGFLARMYREGLGVAQNYPESARLDRLGCDGGHYISCAALGEQYENAQGVPQDYAQAATLYRMACERSSRLCFYLAHLYEHGHGVPRDADEARRLYRKACDAGWTQACEGYDSGDYE